MRWSGRPTEDIDGLVRGDIDHFVDALDAALSEPWGPLELSRTESAVIEVPDELVKPRRFTLWRNIQVATRHQRLAAPRGGALLPARRGIPGEGAV